MQVHANSCINLCGIEMRSIRRKELTQEKKAQESTSGLQLYCASQLLQVSRAYVGGITVYGTLLGRRGSSLRWGPWPPLTPSLAMRMVA